MRFEDYRPAGEQGAAASAGVALELVRDTVEAEIFRPNPQARVRGWFASGLCWLLAAAAHAAVIGGLSVAIEADVAGASGSTSDALGIEVAIVSASALESRRPDTDALSTSAAQPDDGDGASAQDAVQRPDEINAVKAEAQPVIQAKPDPSPVESEDVIVVAERKQDATPDEEKPDENKIEAPTASPTAQTNAGARAIAAAETATTVPQQAAAAASPGAVNRYARSIADVLAKSRPKASVLRSRGTVKVAFAIADDGKPEFVRVTSSSGDKRLDDVAMAAISSVAFPPPPPGMTLVQRTYEVPYFFR